MASDGSPVQKPVRRWGPVWAPSTLALFSILAMALCARWPMWVGGLQIDEDATLADHAQDRLSVLIYTWRNHPPANLAAYATAQLCPWPEWQLAAARVPSLLAGLASVALLYGLILRHTHCVLAAVVPAVLLALSAEHIAFSTSVRGYAIQSCCVLAMQGLWLEWMTAPDDDRGCTHRALWPAYALVATCALWTHLFAIYVLAAHGLVMAYRLRRQPREVLTAWAWMALAVAGALALLWPVLPEIVQGNQDAPRTRVQIWGEFWWGLDTNLRCEHYPAWCVKWGTLLAALVGWRTWTGSPVARATAGVLVVIPALLLAHPPGAFGTRYVLFYMLLFYVFAGLVIAASSAGRAFTQGHQGAGAERPAWNDLLFRLLLVGAASGAVISLLAPWVIRWESTAAVVTVIHRFFELLPWLLLVVAPPRRWQTWERWVAYALAAVTALWWLDLLSSSPWHVAGEAIALGAVVAATWLASRADLTRQNGLSQRSDL